MSSVEVARSPRAPRAAFEIQRGDDGLTIAGELRMADAADVWRTLRKLSRDTGGKRLDLVLRDASVVDGVIMALLVEIRAQLVARGVPSEIVLASDRVRPLVHLYRGDEPPLARENPARVGLLERLGRTVASVPTSATRLLTFVGELVLGAAGALRHPTSANPGSLAALAERAGIDGVPIVLVLDFLVGFVMAFQSTNYLKLYGANVYVADVVGISLTRELVPLMTGIIVAGRSGAAYASEIGAMKVSEELDAMRTLGLSPPRWLVLPRIIALALVAPVLTLLGDVVGLLGGAVVGATSLGVTPRGYLAELQTAVFARDIYTGLVKAVAFGMAIAFIGCRQGFATTGGAEGVGRRTTATIVQCLFAIVLIDTLLTLVFRVLAL